jgi:hypothetical protein
MDFLDDGLTVVPQHVVRRFGESGDGRKRVKG